MSHFFECPSCGGLDSEVVGRLPTTELRRLYSRVVGLDPMEELVKSGPLRLVRCAPCGLRYFDPCTPGSAQFYDFLQEKSFYYPREKPEFLFAGRYVSGMRVLEIGAGHGLFARHVSSRATYVGLELSPAAAAVARLSGFDVREEALEEHGCGDSHYEAVVSFQVLEHVPSPRSFLAAAIGLLQYGGLLVVSVPDCDGFMGSLLDNPLNLPPHHVTWWNERSLRALTRVHPIELVAFQRDPLSPEHGNAVATSLLRKALGFRVPDDALCRADWAYLLAGRALARSAARPLGAALAAQSWATGHSITAVYRRTEGETR